MELFAFTAQLDGELFGAKFHKLNFLLGANGTYKSTLLRSIFSNSQLRSRSFEEDLDKFRFDSRVADVKIMWKIDNFEVDPDPELVDVLGRLEVEDDLIGSTRIALLRTLVNLVLNRGHEDLTSDVASWTESMSPEERISLLEQIASRELYLVSSQNDWELYAYLSDDQLLESLSPSLVDSEKLFLFREKFPDTDFHSWSMDALFPHDTSQRDVYLDQSGIFLPLLRRGTSANSMWEIGLVGETLPLLVDASLSEISVEHRLEGEISKLLSRILGVITDSEYRVDVDEHNISRWFYEDSDEWNRLVKPLLSWFEDVANQLLPTFISDRFRISLRLRSIGEILRERESQTTFIEIILLDKLFDLPDLQTTRDAKIDLDWILDLPTFNEAVFQDRHRVPVTEAGSGILKWVAITLDLAAGCFWEEFRIVQRGDQSGAVVDLVQQFNKNIAVTTTLQDSERVMRVLLHEYLPCVDLKNIVLFLDEPEAHLHKKAVVSISSWMTRMSELGLTIISATHEPRLLTTRQDSALSTPVSMPKKFILYRAPEDAKRVQLVDWLKHVSALSEATFDSGILDEELGALTKLWLYVEGEADLFVIDAWYGDQLRLQGIKILPMRGSRNFNGLTVFDHLVKMKNNIALLWDKESPAQSAMQKSIQKDFRKKINLYRKVGSTEQSSIRGELKISHFHHLKYDIFMYFEPTILKRLGLIKWRGAEPDPNFDWDKEIDLFAASQGDKRWAFQDFKKWVEDRWGLKWTAGNARRIAQQAKLDCDVNSYDLHKVIEKIINQTMP